MFLGKRFFIVLIMFFWIAGSAASLSHAREEAWQKELNKIEYDMIADGNYEEAVSNLNEMLKEHPEKARIYMDLAQGYYGLMGYAKAYTYLEKAKEIGTKGEEKRALLYMMSSIEKNRDILEEIEKLNDFLKKQDVGKYEVIRQQMTTAHFTVLNRLLGEKYYYPAVVMPHIMWLKENVPGMEGLNGLSGDVYYAAMYYKEAIESYKKAIEEDPENIQIRRALADCQVALGDFDNAQESYQETIALYKSKGFKRTSSEVIELEKIKGSLPKKYKDISDLMKAGRLNAAEEICRKRISLNPGDYAAITQLGEIYWKKDKKRAAIRLFRKVIRRAPDYPVAHFFLGKAYVFEHKPGKAINQFNIFKQTMEMLPAMDEDTVDFYVSALHYISYMYFTLKRYDEVITECRRIIKLKPDDQRAHYNLAVAYYLGYNEPSRAYRELQKVIAIDSSTYMADVAKYYTDYIRRNPDPRLMSDFTFIYEE